MVRHSGHLAQLESEAIFIMREVSRQCLNPVLLFSGGKDSAVLLRLAEKAFRPRAFPFPIMHVDTGHNFPEAIVFRDKRIGELAEKLIVASVMESISRHGIHESEGASRNWLQALSLMDAIHDHRFDCAIGGARRDEEKSRAKERIFSVRGYDGAWKPEHQRPEVGMLLNASPPVDGHIRAFPLSNWTELDIWEYIAEEEMDLPSLYFSHFRLVFSSQGKLVPVSAFINVTGAVPTVRQVRFRTVGDMTCTAAIPSTASSPREVINELRMTSISERGASRLDDLVGENAMEDRKREGYF